MYLRRTCNKCNCLLHLTELSLGTIVGVFLDEKPSKGLRSANDTETFRDVSLTNNLILYANRNEVGSWKRSLVFLSFHVLAAHPFPNFPWGKRQDPMTSLASRKQEWRARTRAKRLINSWTKDHAQYRLIIRVGSQGFRDSRTVTLQCPRDQRR